MDHAGGRFRAPGRLGEALSLRGWEQGPHTSFDFWQKVGTCCLLLILSDVQWLTSGVLNLGIPVSFPKVISLLRNL